MSKRRARTYGAPPRKLSAHDAGVPSRVADPFYDVCARIGEPHPAQREGNDGRINGVGQGGLFYTGSFHQLGAQAIAVTASFVTVFVLSYSLFWIIKKTVGLRVSPREEMDGLDISEHGMWGYPESFMPVPGGIYRPADMPTVNPHHSSDPVPTHGEVARA